DRPGAHVHARGLAARHRAHARGRSRQRAVLVSQGRPDLPGSRRRAERDRCGANGRGSRNPRMTLRQCEVFLAVARERSFSLAAKKIRLSQPTLSEHMTELEKELGAELFSRRGRSVALTEAGRVFHSYAAQVVTAAEGGRQAVLELGGLARG